MILQPFTISTIPTTVTVPGTGDMPDHLVTVGGIRAIEGQDYSRVGRVFSFPSLEQARRLTVKEAANGVRRLFTTKEIFVIPLVVVSLWNQLLTPELYSTPTNQSISINTPSPPAQGVLVIVSAYALNNFLPGDKGEIREV